MKMERRTVFELIKHIIPLRINSLCISTEITATLTPWKVMELKILLTSSFVLVTFVTFASSIWASATTLPDRKVMDTMRTKNTPMGLKSWSYWKKCNRPVALVAAFQHWFANSLRHNIRIMKENNGVCSKLQIFQVKAKATFGLDFL